MWLSASLWAGLLSCFFSTRKAPSLADNSLAPLKKGLFITIPYSSEVIFQSAWPFLFWNRVLRPVVPANSCGRVMP